LKIFESAENYLETILILQKRNGEVRSIDIANELDFTRPSVSNAMKQFRQNGYITMDNKGYITLTERGMKIAISMYERHIILSKFLIALGIEEDMAKEDACRIEHVISQTTFNKIKEQYEKTFIE
jgi:DtxR family Mn-dependent transcriptional regulator